MQISAIIGLFSDNNSHKLLRFTQISAENMQFDEEDGALLMVNNLHTNEKHW